MISVSKGFFTKKRAMAFALAAMLAVAAAAGWKMGSEEAIGRYLTAPVTLMLIE